MPRCWLPCISGCCCPTRTAGRWPARRCWRWSSSSADCGCARDRSRTSGLQSFATTQPCGGRFAIACGTSLRCSRVGGSAGRIGVAAFFVPADMRRSSESGGGRRSRYCASAVRVRCLISREWLLWIVMALLVAVWLPVATHRGRRGIQAGADGAFVAPAQARLVLAVVCRACDRWRVCPVQAGLVDSRRRHADKAGLERGAASCAAYVLLISAWIALLLVIGDRVEKEDPEAITVAN